jgi:branched-chain amino acid transport system permease protein
MEKPYLVKEKSKSGIHRFGEKINGVPSYLKDWALNFKGGITLLCLGIFIIFPLFTQNEYYLQVIILCFIYSIFAASWDLLAGYTGKVSFGHAIFFGISAYTVSAFLVFNNFSWWSSLILGVIYAVVTGFLIGIVCLRLKGPYLAVGTMVIGLLFQNLFKIGPLKPLLWGDEGIPNVPPISTDSTLVYYIVLFLMVISIITMIQITKSNTGTIFKSIRDDEKGSEASGINTTRYKIIAFIISAGFAGLAGGLYAMYNRSVNPLIYQPLYSFMVLIMAALGGIATIKGSILGAFTWVILSQILVELSALKIAENPILAAFTTPAFVFSILLILIIRFVSEGILSFALEKLKETWDILLGR